MHLSVDRQNKHATGQICTRKGYLLTNGAKKYLKEALETGRAVSSEQPGPHDCGGYRATDGWIPQSSRNTLFLPCCSPTVWIQSLERVAIQPPLPRMDWDAWSGCLTQDCGEMAGVVRGQRSVSQSSLALDLLLIYWTSSDTHGCTCQAGGSVDPWTHKCSILTVNKAERVSSDIVYARVLVDKVLYLHICILSVAVQWHVWYETSKNTRARMDEAHSKRGSLCLIIKGVLLILIKSSEFCSFSLLYLPFFLIASRCFVVGGKYTLTSHLQSAAALKYHPGLRLIQPQYTWQQIQVFHLAGALLSAGLFHTCSDDSDKCSTVLGSCRLLWCGNQCYRHEEFLSNSLLGLKPLQANRKTPAIHWPNIRWTRSINWERGPWRLCWRP